jgi:hypothetical protein
LPIKKGAKPIYLSASVDVLVQKKMQEDGWAWDKTKFCENVLSDYAAGKLVQAGEVATEKLFLTMFGLGLIDEKRLADVLALIRGGTLPASVQSDKLGIKIESVRDPKNKK